VDGQGASKRVTVERLRGTTARRGGGRGSEGSTGRQGSTKARWSAATKAMDEAVATACEEEGSRAVAAPWRRSRGRRQMEGGERNDG
jgi:hypothetical protein